MKTDTFILKYDYAIIQKLRGVDLVGSPEKSRFL